MLPRFLCVIGLVVVVAFPATAQTMDPARFVPSRAEIVVKVDRPRTLIEAVEKNELFQQAQKLAGLRDYYETATYQQIYQLVAYFEKQLGKDRNEIIDDISAGGVVFAARLTNPKGAMLVIQSKDEAKLRKFLDVAFDILDKELERQESKDKVVRSKYQGYEVGKIGPKISFAIADGALVIAPEEVELKAALDVVKKKQSILNVPGFLDARKHAAPQAMAWAWLNVEELRKDDNFRNGLNAASLDPFQMMIFGGFSDLLKRTPYLTASLTAEGTGYRLSAYAPRGANGMAPVKHMFLPSKEGGTMPPLNPPRVLATTSYHLDLGQFWEKRREILGEKNAKGLDEGEKGISKVLGTIKLSKLLQGMGTNHRLVFAQQKERPYKKQPASPFPAFALVVEMRDPSFAKDMNTVLRSAALLATFSYGLQLKEETYKDCELVSYYFSETKKVEGDPNNTRFNFSPSYLTVGNYFVASATAELARDLVDVLRAEQKSKPSGASMRSQLYASGLAEIVRSNEDAALTQLILSQALPPMAARDELRAYLNLVEQLGSLSQETRYGANDWRYEIVWQPRKK